MSRDELAVLAARIFLAAFVPKVFSLEMVFIHYGLINLHLGHQQVQAAYISFQAWDQRHA